MENRKILGKYDTPVALCSLPLNGIIMGVSYIIGNYFLCTALAITTTMTVLILIKRYEGK